MAAIVWAPRALDDLDALVEYIACDSQVHARRFAARIFQRVESLASQPESGSWLPEDDRGIYRQILQNPYRIIYRHDQEEVLIVAVHHAARLLGSIDIEHG